MENTHSIIVYRNPLEKQFWEEGLILPVAAGVFAAFCTMMLAIWLCSSYNRWRAHNSPYQQMTKTQSNIIVVVGILSCVLTIWFLT